MTVKELQTELNKLIKNGKENLPVQISIYEKDNNYCGGYINYDIDGIWDNYKDYVELSLER